MRSSSRTRRLTSYAASALLVLGGGLLAASPATAVVTADPIGVDEGTTWLTSQLSRGILHNDQYDFDDYGLTADAALALDAVGGHGATVSQIANAIEAGAHDSWYTSTFKGTTTTYAGSVAKLLVLVQAAGGTPTSYGGHDLLALLNGLTATTPPVAGRIEDTNNDFGDANTVGQAFAVHGLATAGSAKAAAARGFLLKQQCSAGFFRLTFASRTATDQTCDGDASSAPDTDATAVALLQLEALQSSDSSVVNAIAQGRSWLRSTQKPDGSWGGGTNTEVANANSTGLAASALGNSTEARQAATWLRDHQVTGLDACNALAGQQGAIAYDDAGRSAGRRDGITVTSTDQWRRATTQALPALRWLPSVASAPLSLSGPAGYRKAGGRAQLDTDGAVAGTQLCLVGPGVRVRRTTSGGTWSNLVTLPAGTGRRTYTVHDAHGHADSAVVRVLGRKTLDVSTSGTTVHRSDTITAVVSGLAGGEHARVLYRGTVVASGDAGRRGRFVATIHVVRVLGDQTITGYGQFADIRRGSTVIKVVR